MKDKKYSLSQYICSYIGLALMIVYYQLSDTVIFLPVMNNILILSLPFFALQYAMEGRYRVKNLVLITVLIVVLAFQYKKTNDSRLMVYVLALLGLKNVPVKRIMSFILYEKLILIGAVMAVSTVGIGFVERTNEYTLGFTHGNLFMINVVEIFLLYICLNWRKVNYRSNIIIAVLVILTFLVSESRTGLVLFALSFVLFLYIKYSRKKNIKSLNVLTIITPVILFIISITVPYLMSIRWFDSHPALNNYVTKFDTMLTSRFTLGSIRLKYTKIHLLYSTTNKSRMSLYRYTVVDSGYVQLLLVFGALGSILFLIYYTQLIRKISQMNMLGREKNIYLLSVLILSMNAFTENSLCSLKYNFTLFFVLLINENKTLLLLSNIMKKFSVRGNHVKIKC